jgi:RNA polymerase sigma-70 factor (ECF subfamily)
MMRITVGRQDRVPWLRVEGRVTGAGPEELRTACEAVLAGGTGVQLDLSGVTFIDRAGTAVLRGLVRRGANLLACSGFLHELLRQGRDDTPPDRGAPFSVAVSEATLLEGLRRGDAAAFETLVRQYSGRLLATARRMLRSEEDAHDVVQESFASAFKSMGTFAGDAQLSTWLHRIVVNAALMKLRSRRRRPEESIEELLPDFDDRGRFSDEPSGWTATADTLLEQRETRALVRRCIDRLPETYRTVLLLRDIEELDTDEAAQLLEVSANAVKVRLHRARQALRTLLERALAESDRAGVDTSQRGAERPRAQTAAAL